MKIPIGDAQASGDRGTPTDASDGELAPAPAALVAAHAFEVSFSSVTAAIVAKGDLERGVGPPLTPIVCSVAFIANSVLSDKVSLIASHSARTHSERREKRARAVGLMLATCAE